MSLLVQTARVSYGGPGRLDVTRKTGSTLGRVFAPSWETLRPALAAAAIGGEPAAAAWATYVPLYLAEMRISYVKWRPAWAELLALESVVLVCYCTDPTRCHRALLRAQILPALGARDGGEIVPS